MLLKLPYPAALGAAGKRTAREAAPARVKNSYNIKSPGITIVEEHSG